MKDDTLLLRQVHPKFVQDGVATSQAFRPTPKDNRKLSVYDGSQIDAKESWNHYVDELKGKSAGVLAVSVLECTQVGTRPYVDGDGYPEHAVIDFADLGSNSKVTAAGKKLSRYARTRGWQFHPN